jgi:hypothetical protein
MSKMNPEIKARWVAALRSGEYKQTRRKLRDNNGGHCCLGVLCDLFAKEGGKPWRTRELSEQGPHQSYNLLSSLSDANLPGAAVCVWAGLDPYQSGVQIGAVKGTLFDHNDDGCTFAEIADAIEAQL